MELIYKGAEAELYLDEFLGLKVVIKRRVAKGYRHPSLDLSIRVSRTRKEARLIRRARLGGVPVPAILDVWKDSLMLEYIEGEKLAARLDEKTMRKFGHIVCRLHDSGISHNDLTPYNAVVSPRGEICLLDFGLAESTRDVEDYAVDLYVLKRSLKSITDDWEGLWKSFLEGYLECGELADRVLRRLSVVESRGRYN